MALELGEEFELEEFDNEYPPRLKKLWKEVSIYSSAVLITIILLQVSGFRGLFLLLTTSYRDPSRLNPIPSPMFTEYVGASISTGLSIALTGILILCEVMFAVIFVYLIIQVVETVDLTRKHPEKARLLKKGTHHPVKIDNVPVLHYRQNGIAFYQIIALTIINLTFLYTLVISFFVSSYYGFSTILVVLSVFVLASSLVVFVLLKLYLTPALIDGMLLFLDLALSGIIFFVWWLFSKLGFNDDGWIMVYILLLAVFLIDYLVWIRFNEPSFVYIGDDGSNKWQHKID